MENIDKKIILFVVNSDWFFISHRLPIAKKALLEGFKVHIATTFTCKRKELEKFDFFLHDIQINRTSTSLLDNLFLFFKFLSIFKKVNPDLLHLITIKPFLIGGLAAHLIKKAPKIIISVSGLGYIFTVKGIKAFLRKKIIILLYKLVFNHKKLKVIFQNKTDLDNISKETNLSLNKTVLIPGSGVDLKKFKLTKITNKEPIVLFPARLLSTKGIYEFIKCAENLKNKARFAIVGRHDLEARNCIKICELERWQKENIIEYWGESSNMPREYSKASIVVLPSYREGMPKSLLEAAACGRVVITTDVPGCRDAILDGVTGFLVPPYDSIALTNGVEKLLNNPKLIYKMGRQGRYLAEKKFNIDNVVKKHIETYRDPF